VSVNRKIKVPISLYFLFAVQTLLKEKYPQIAERIILMALESVNYAEDRATQILQIVQDEDEQRAQKQAPSKTKHLELDKTTTGTEQVDGATGDRYPYDFTFTPTNQGRCHLLFPTTSLSLARCFIRLLIDCLFSM